MNSSGKQLFLQTTTLRCFKKSEFAGCYHIFLLLSQLLCQTIYLKGKGAERKFSW